MHDIWIAVIIGIIEGLTEFLPVSSTGHMILAGHMIGFQGEKADTFEIVIQLGAILAVVVLYWNRVLRLFGLMPKQQSKGNGPRMNLLHILIAITPALAIGFLLRHFIKEVLFSPQTVLIGLVLGGIFMIIAEKKHPRFTADDMDQLTYKQALFIGISQILSLWPGFSRSGATIAGGMLAGASRAASADFTFLIAIPVMIAATGYELLKSFHSLTSGDLVFFAVGFVVSFIVALLAVMSFIKLVQKLSLTYFSYYRFVLAGIVLLYMIFVGFD
ncbi:undecaprenyl-diphosphate phosphatase [Ferviditalea candida]|uniref:Undecaprenyl-diphosphatase n=1 Tax=Ferviditalea candida TaxID=3108399 RepID=A0ABU5ZJP7_9BACL|nr:undecaprenyl-diphosphate phosphatase [Paenibacillaceae bacterium T2]